MDDVTNNKAAGAGRGKGTSNFRVDEDIHLAHAYVFVTTNAAVGTDQDANTFWEKITEIFVRRGGSASRSSVSLKNRFNKVLQFEINKYLGILHGVFRSHYSGWSVNDYISKAKDVYMAQFGKPFKHEKVYDVLKRSLPKYEIDTSSINARVVRALFMISNDRAVEADQLERDAIGAGGTHAPPPAGNGGNIPTTTLRRTNETSEDSSGPDDGRMEKLDTSYIVNARLLAIQRPTIGKKKAKMLAAKAYSGSKGKKAIELPVAPLVCNASILVKQARNDELKRLANAVESKNALFQEQLMFQVFMANPQSADSIAYFKQRSKQYMSRLAGVTTEEKNGDEHVVTGNKNKDATIEKTKEKMADLSDNGDEDYSDDESVVLLERAANRPLVVVLTNTDDNDDDDESVVFLPALTRNHVVKNVDIKKVYIKSEYIANRDNVNDLFALPGTQGLLSTLNKFGAEYYSTSEEDATAAIGNEAMEEKKEQDDALFEYGTETTHLN
ncbi:No apical meristem-associated C-terminal domain [Fragilaria crotonensis]|nr:No apical meristem-associated C-terminal domain [Fragilaria crotonensis]